MFQPPFYNEHIRTITLVFGTLFNNIHIVRRLQDGTQINQVKVPIAYGPKEKFIARLDERQNLNDPVKAITLPRLSFEMTGIAYDSSRKQNKFNSAACTGSINSLDGDPAKRTEIKQGVPYTLTFELHVLTNTRDDALQVIEQILPFFTPSFNVTIKPIESLGNQITQDVKFTLDSVSSTDDYEGEFESIRRIEHTLTFSAKMLFLGDLTKESNVIKTAIVNYSDSETGDGIVSIEYEVDPPTAEKDDPFTITVNETYGWEQ